MMAMTVEEAVWNARRANLRHKIMYTILQEARDGMPKSLIKDAVKEASDQIFCEWELEKKT